MNKKSVSLVAVFLLCGSAISHADFKYTETSKITGGMMADMMKFAGAFGKDAKKATAPTETTRMVKGNRLRQDDSEGGISIIDLDGRRIIHIDPKARTYSVMTFDQMRAALEDAQAKMKEQQQQQKKKSGQEAPKVKMTPKFESSATGNRKVILDQPTNEYKVKMEMQMEIDDPKYKDQKMTTWFTSDAWVAPSVKGYDEIRKFYVRMAKELDWIPGAVFGGNSQISNSMTEFRKNTANMDGLPLVQYASFGMGGMVPPGQAGTAAQASSGKPAQTSQSSEQVGTPGEAAAKALGGMLGGFGGFGKKKKKSAESTPSSEESSTASKGSAPPEGAFTSGSMMDMTTEVTSFSNGSLDSSLFEIPAGYTQVEGGADQMLGRKRQ